MTRLHAVPPPEGQHSIRRVARRFLWDAPFHVRFLSAYAIALPLVLAIHFIWTGRPW